jgi:hypothetical protein
MHDDDRLPRDLERIADRLRHHREDPSALEMDLMKQRVSGRLADATSPTRKGTMRARITAVVVALATVAGTTGAAIAFAPRGHENSPPQQHSASHWQYKPGKGCGDKNHYHQRRHECKKHDHGHGHGQKNDHEHGHGSDHGHSNSKHSGKHH